MVRDVKDMISNGLVDPADARAQFELVEPKLYRFPAIDPASFRKSVEELFGQMGREGLEPSTDGL